LAGIPRVHRLRVAAPALGAERQIPDILQNPPKSGLRGPVRGNLDGFRLIFCETQKMTNADALKDACNELKPVLAAPAVIQCENRARACAETSGSYEANQMQSTSKKALVTQERDLHTYAELWHASECVLAAGIEHPRGSSWQFLSSIVLTAFSLEAYLNHVGPQVLSCWRSLERLSPNSKLELLCEALKVGLPGTKGERPLQTISELFRFRNTLAHGRSETIIPEPKSVDVDELEAHRTESLLSNWERLIEDYEFAKRAREDVETVLKVLQAARPEPKEALFRFGGRTWSATV
jgi:hypothetical protein